MKLTKYFAFALAIISFVACGGDTDGDGKDTANSATLTASNNSVTVNTPVYFTVTATDGTDLTAEAIIFNKSNDYEVVSNPFTPTKDGEYIFFASAGSKIITNSLTINVVPTIPELPTDPQPDNTSFHHRILLVDHTGNTCGNCPKMMLALKQVAEKEAAEGEVSYHDKYYEAMAHSYNNQDPAYSQTAGFVSTHYGINAYPNLTYNFYHSVISSSVYDHIVNQIDALWKADGADVGIAASSTVANSCVVVNTEIKVATENEYHITAWLLEDNISAKQTGAKEEWMNNHNNAIRQRIASDDITGANLGTIAAGTTKTTALTLRIDTDKWNRENFKVLVIVSAKNSKGKFDVANVALCPANGSVTYDYNE